MQGSQHATHRKRTSVSHLTKRDEKDKQDSSRAVVSRENCYVEVQYGGFTSSISLTHSRYVHTCMN